MPRIRTMVSRGLDVFVRRRRDARLEEELRTHLDHLIEHYEQEGHSHDAAVKAARRSLGGLDRVRATYRDQRGWPALETWIHDGRLAMRLLWRDRRFTLAVVGVLALGIGVSHLFFTLTYAHTVRGLPTPQIERVLHVGTLDASGSQRGVSYADFLDLRSAQRSFEDLAALTTIPVALGAHDRAPERVEATYTTASAFSMARVRPVLGRVVEPRDEVAGSPAVAVIAERLWRSRYHGDTRLLEQEVEVNGAPVTIVGIVTDTSGYPSAAVMWLPLIQLPLAIGASRDARTLTVFGRLAADVTPAAGRADLEGIAARLADAFPTTNRDRRLLVVPLNERFTAPRAGWWPFILAGAIVIVISSLNVGNLLLVRGARRVRELAMRVAMGASRARLVRQLLIETLAVSIVGGSLGLMLSRLGVRVHERNIPEAFHPYWAWYSVDETVLVGLVVLMMVTACVGGVAPAFLTSTVDPITAFRDGGRRGSTRFASRALASSLLGFQIALAVVVMTQVGISAVEARRDRLPTDTTLSRTDVLTASYALTATDYATQGSRRQFHERALDALADGPGAEGRALATHLPLAGASEYSLRVDGQSTSDPGRAPSVWAVAVTSEYFDVLGLPLRVGRTLGRRVTEGGTLGEVVVNERLASLYFPEGNALGSRVALDSTQPGSWAHIVGIVADARQHPGVEARPIAYVSLLELAPTSAFVVVRALGTQASALRAAFMRLDPLLPLFQIQSLGAARWNVQWLGRASERLALMVTMSVALLAIAGLYAVLPHRLASATREMGLRLALGASPLVIARFVSLRAGPALALGLIGGLLGVFGWSRAFAPAALASAAAVGKLAVASVLSLVAIAVIAAWWPARRAMRLQPAEALRHDA